MTESALDPSRPQAAATPPNAAAIFSAFFLVSLTGFGGVMPWTRRMVIEKRRWMSAQEFNEALSLCQVLPGPNMLNFAVVFGLRYAGAAGALAAVAGVLAFPVGLAVAIGALYRAYGEVAVVERVLAGLGASAAGLLVGTSAKMAQPLFRRAREPGAFLAVLVFGAMAVFRWPLLAVLLGAIPVSLAVHWWWWRRRRVS